MSKNSAVSSDFSKLNQLSSVPVDEEDAVLMKQVCAGSRAAYQKLYLKYRRPIMSFLRTMIADREAVEEVFQDTFLKLYRARDSYEKRAKFSTFLWTIAKHTAFDYLDKKKEFLLSSREGEDGGILESEIDRLESPAPDAERALIEAAEDESLWSCISALPEKDRLLCGLRMHSELSYDEIAAQTQQPLGTVKTRLFRIRGLLLECMRRKGRVG